MGGTYASLALILPASAAAGQGLFALCGRREWTWLSPAVGLSVLIAVAWGALNLSDEPVIGLAACGLVAALGLVAWVTQREAAAGRGSEDAALVGAVVLVAAVALASLPFVVEGRFGILGTSLNPDMSQHLFAADRLTFGGEERLITESYPLGPHALVVAVSEVGPSLVHAFSGLTVAISVAAALASLQILATLAPARRIAAALLVGFAYMASSYLIQGAFKETLQALIVLAFAIGLHDLAGGRLGGANPAARWRLMSVIPLAALAVGSIYAYSFPGLAWLLGAIGIWALAELAARRSLEPLRTALVQVAIGTAVLLAAVAPELGRIADFASFETFDPDGAGYGNLFPGHPLSPIEALGIWPSGDFRLEAGAGFAPTAAFWLGGLVGLLAVGYGFAWWLRRGERAVPAALAAAAILYLYPLVAGTPYQEAKAIAIAAPLAMLIIVRALFEATPPLGELRARAPQALAVPALAVAFAVPAAACSALALANGPVGPGDWSPALIELRESGQLGPGGENGDDTLVQASREVLVDQHGEDLLLWELRGGNVCALALPEPEEGLQPLPTPLPRVDHMILYRGAYDVRLRRVPGPRPPPGSACPFIADGDRADPGD